MDADLTITHDYMGGTTLWGTSRGDGSAEVVKPLGWRWSRVLGVWFLPRSRWGRPNRPGIDRAVAALTEAGFTVVTEIDERVPPVAEVESARAEVQAERVERLGVKADRARAEEEAAWGRHERAAAKLPPGGEPIKAGHHSEARHARAVERSWDSLEKWADANDAAKDAERAAVAATRTTSGRFAPVTVANRIERLSAELRAEVRGPHRLHRVEDLSAQVEYWRRVRDEQVAAGRVVDYGPDDISKGDLVRSAHRDEWHKVMRVNMKSVSVRSWSGVTVRLPYHSISGHRKVGS